jgi:hypothetical protein
MTYFKVYTNPHAVFMTVDMIKDEEIIDKDAKVRLKELVDETIALSLKLS